MVQHTLGTLSYKRYIATVSTNGYSRLNKQFTDQMNVKSTKFWAIYVQ